MAFSALVSQRDQGLDFRGAVGTFQRAGWRGKPRYILSRLRLVHYVRRYVQNCLTS